TQTKGNIRIMGETQVQVGNADLARLALDLVPGVTVKGEVRMPAAPAAPARLPRGGPGAQVLLTPIGTDFVTILRTGTDEQGLFSLENVRPGRYRLSVKAYFGYAAAAFSGTQD